MSRPFTSKSGGRAPAVASEANAIGPSVRIRGRVSGEGDLRVEGSVEGDVRVTGALAIDGRGTVLGNTAANSVEVEGTLTGDISAVGAVHIRGGARVTGNVTGAEIALDETAAFVGRIEADFELPDDLEGTSAAPQAVRRRR